MKAKAKTIALALTVNFTVLVGCSNDATNSQSTTAPVIGLGNTSTESSDEFDDDPNEPVDSELTIVNLKDRLGNAIHTARGEYLTDLLIGIESLGIDWESGNQGTTRDGQTLAISDTHDCPRAGQLKREYRFKNATSLDYSSHFTLVECESANWTFNGSITRDQRYQFAGHGSLNASVYHFNQLEAIEKSTEPAHTNHTVHGSVEINSQVTGFSDEFRLIIALDSYQSSQDGLMQNDAQGIDYLQEYFVATMAADESNPGASNYFRESMTIASITVSESSGEDSAEVSADGARDELSTQSVLEYAHEDSTSDLTGGFNSSFRGFADHPDSGSITLTSQSGSSVHITANASDTAYHLENSNSNVTYNEDWILTTRCHRLTQLHHDTCRLNQP